MGIIQLLPNNGTLANINATIGQNAHGAPSWLAFIDMHVKYALNQIASNNGYIKVNSNMPGMYMKYHSNAGKGYWLILLISIIEILIGLGVYIRHIGRKIALIGSIIISLFFWIVGQSLGQFYSGYATDLNTAPLIILLAITLLEMSPALDIYLNKIKLNIEKNII